MSINLIDSLLDEQPRIDYEGYRIYSDVPLSNILGSLTQGEDKSEYVAYDNYLDVLEKERQRYDATNSGRTYTTNYYNYNSSRYRDFWSQLGLDRFVISSKLLRFFVNECDDTTVRGIFSMDIQYIKDRDTTLNIFNTLISKFNYLKEGVGGYLIYGRKGSQIRYGKFINMLSELFYKNNISPSIRQQEIERAVDVYKTKFSTGEYRICVLSGDDILLGYDRKYQIRKTDTMLYQSCMNDKLDLLKLYTINPNKIYLLAITNGDGKIISRNLMWRLNKYNNFLFDRVYAVDNYVRNSAIKVAQMEHWIMYHEGIGVGEIQKIDLSGESKKISGSNLKIKLNLKGLNLYPYMDTFAWQRLGTNILTNRQLDRFNHRYHHTNGGRSTTRII